MYGVYKLNSRTNNNGNSVPLDVLTKISKDDTQSRASVVQDADKQINEICENCLLIEQKWNASKSVYKIIEACSILFNMILSITCVSLSCIYLTQFHSILDYLKEINVLNSQLFIYYPFFYVCCEIASFLLDLVRLFGTAQVAKLFHYENKQKRLIERKITRTDDFLISQAQNNKTMHIILNLKLRNKMRKKFKQLFTHLIWIEILINIYFMVFVIANKISAASYLKFSLLNEFTLDSTKLIQANSMFECCQISDSSNSTQLVCLNNQEELDCLHDNIDFYLNMIVTLFFSTSLFKLIVQVVFIVNLKVILIDDFIMKHMSREENLSKQYETFQAYLFTQSVQERIEYNAKEMANNLEKLKGQRTSSKRKKTTEKGNRRKSITQNANNIHQVAYYNSDQNDY